MLSFATRFSLPKNSNIFTKYAYNGFINNHKYILSNFLFSTQNLNSHPSSENVYENTNENMYNEDNSSSLKYNVHNDPYWTQLSSRTQRRYSFSQRMKKRHRWPNHIIPIAAKTSFFNYKTIKALQRFPSLGNFSQMSSHKYDSKNSHLNINSIKLNSPKSSIFYKQPSSKHLMQLLNKREISLYHNKDINYNIKAGDTIELQLYINLNKKDKHMIAKGLVLMVRKKTSNGGSFIIRTCEPDGLIIYRQYLLHNPWIKSLKIISSQKTKRRRLYYMYKAPSSVENISDYDKKIGVRSRREFFNWLTKDPEGRQYAADIKLSKRMNFLGMRKRLKFAIHLAKLYNATAITSKIRGPYRNARREMKYRLKAKPHKVA